jgi:putative photosynthetic complex assembly protein 2
MAQYGLPVLHGLLIWWFSTGLILFLDGLRRETFRYSMAGATLLLLAALYGLRDSALDTSVTGAYTAFTCAVLIWGWLEISFYMGYVTGPRTHHCHHGCSGWRHFGHAIQASLYHEIAVLILAAAVIAITWGSTNQFGLWTFVVLWWMHQSARLNVFLGVSNLNAEFLPEHLAHIRSFFRSAPMNPLFPFSATLSTIAAVLLAQQALLDPTDTFRVTGYILVTTMMVLAILEHWFLVMPPSAARMWNSLWQWSLGSRGAGGKARQQQTPLPRQATIGGRP